MTALMRSCDLFSVPDLPILPTYLLRRHTYSTLLARIPMNLLMNPVLFPILPLSAFTHERAVIVYFLFYPSSCDHLYSINYFF